jgi:CRISPR-associated endonuclease Csn1
VLPGKCALDPARDPSDLGGMRAPWALPLAQRFRIVQELANLRIVRSDYSQVRLDAKQRDLLLGELLKKKKVSFDAMRRALGLSSEHRFNLESEKRQDLQGDETAAVLADKKRFGKRWHELDPDQQTAIVERLLSEPDEAVLISWLQGEWGLDAEAAEAVADAPVPDGYCRLGRRALSRIVPIMEDQGLGYADAAREAGYDHSDRRPEDLLDELPYYGEALADHVVGTGDPDDPPEARFGRIANPTVHVGLNQLRKLVNALIETHGRPHQIVIELARELKQSQKEKERIQKEQAENQKKNDARRAQLAECGQADNGENRMRLRLWEELDPVDALGRRCVYTGEVIGMRRLFSDEVEIDHILPFSKTLDNSAANRIVSLRRANREKGNRTPYEAWGHDAKRWQEILERAKSLKKNKRWRFAADAMESFQANRDFLDRQLTDTAYLGRVAKAYLTNVCPDNRVYVVTGQLTALLRAKWGLNAFLSDANQKNRTDHRHHAIDAIVAAVTDRSMLQRIATAAGRTEREDRERLVADMPEPWDGPWHGRTPARENRLRHPRRSGPRGRIYPGRPRAARLAHRKQDRAHPRPGIAQARARPRPLGDGHGPETNGPAAEGGAGRVRGGHRGSPRSPIEKGSRLRRHRRRNGAPLQGLHPRRQSPHRHLSPAGWLMGRGGRHRLPGQPAELHPGVETKVSGSAADHARAQGGPA